jgi:hypothetical protein
MIRVTATAPRRPRVNDDEFGFKTFKLFKTFATFGTTGTNELLPVTGPSLFHLEAQSETAVLNNPGTPCV